MERFSIYTNLITDSGGGTTNRETCLATALRNWNSDCSNNSWLNFGSSRWTLTQHTGFSYVVFIANLMYTMSQTGASSSWDVHPSMYLTSNIGISGGEGSFDSPFTIKV